jgi:hypothetical protein
MHVAAIICSAGGERRAGQCGILALRDTLMAQANFAPGDYPFYAAFFLAGGAGCVEGTSGVVRDQPARMAEDGFTIEKNDRL